MTLFDIIAQGVGILGIIASIISFQCKKHKPLMVFRTLNETLFAVQYIMLGAYTGAAMNIVGSIRNVIFAKQVEKGKSTKPTGVVFSLAFILFCIATWSGIKSVLIGFAKVVSTFAYGNSNTTFVRFMILLTSSMWLVYNFLVKSYAGCLCELFTLCSIVVGIIRFDILKLSAEEKTAE